MGPQAHGYLLHAAFDQVLVFVAAREHHAQDLQHGVGKVGVPAAGAKAHLPEHLAVVEGKLGKGIGLGHKIVESAVVPQGHQRVPERFQTGHIPLAQGLLHVRKPRIGFQRLGPGVGHFVEQRGQIGQGAGVVGLAFDVHHRAPGGRGERVGEGLVLQPELVDIVKERRAGGGEAHATQLGHDAGCAGKSL